MGIKYRIKITLGCLEIGKEEKKKPRPAARAVPSSALEAASSAFHRGFGWLLVDFSWEFFYLWQPIWLPQCPNPRFRPKMCFFSPPKCLSHHLLHAEEQAGKGLWIRSQMGIGSSRKTSAEFVFEIFFKSWGIFSLGIEGSPFPCRPRERRWAGAAAPGTELLLLFQ